MTISVIYKVGGDDLARYKRVQESIRRIRMTHDLEYEIILVEQSMDGNHYYEGLDVDIYKAIYGTEGFCVAWCANVGARLASGDTLVFMDADIIVPAYYLNYIEEFGVPTAAYGAKCYVSATKEQTNEYWKISKIENIVDNAQTVYCPNVYPYSGHGYIRIFDAIYYWDVLGGHVEDFIGWGFEDTELMLHRVHYMLGIKEPDILHISEVTPVHLYHDAPREQHYNMNWNLFQRLIGIPAEDRCYILKRKEVGDPKRRKPII